MIYKQSKERTMKSINQSELQVGELYCDQPTLHSVNSVVMRYLGKKNGHYEFQYVYGINEYINNGDGIIRIAHYKKEPNWFWKVPEENANILCKTIQNQRDESDQDRFQDE